MANEVQIIISAIDNASNEIKGALGGLNSLQKSFTELRSALGLVNDAYQQVKQVYNSVITESVAYAKSLRELAIVTGTGVEETSALVEAADDAQVEFGTLRMAAKMLANDGIAPTIDNIASLADEYKAIQDPVKQTQFLLEKFGRAGLEMGKMLDMGSTAIKANAEAARELGSVLSEESVQAALEYEMALDSLNDTFTAQKRKVFGEVIPALTSYLKLIQDPAWGRKWTDFIPAGQIFRIKDLAKATEEYELKLKALAAAENAMRGSSQDVIGSYEAKNTAIKKVTDSTAALTGTYMSDLIANWEAEGDRLDRINALFEDHNEQLVNMGVYTQRITTQQEGLANVQDLLAENTDNLAEAQQNLADSEASWMASTAGDVQSMLESRWVTGKKYADALTAIDDVYGTSLATQAQYQTDLKALVDEYRKTGDLDTFKTKLGELKEVYMPLDEQVKQNTTDVLLLQSAIDNLKSKEIWIYQHIITTTSAASMLNQGGSGNTGGAPNPGAGDIGLTPGTTPPPVEEPINGMQGGFNSVTIVQNISNPAAAAIATAQIRMMQAARVNAFMGA